MLLRHNTALSPPRTLAQLSCSAMPPDRMDPAYHPLVDEAPAVHRRRKTKSSGLSPWRCCIWSAGLLALACGAGIAFFLYSVFKEMYRMGAAPHRAYHANETLLFQGPGIADNESQIVRSFFGARDKGGVERFDLKAAIWAKVGTEGGDEREFLSSQSAPNVLLTSFTPRPSLPRRTLDSGLLGERVEGRPDHRQVAQDDSASFAAAIPPVR